MHGVVVALVQSERPTDADQGQKVAWTHANKICRHIIISTLYNNLFDVYCVYKEACKIWESLVTKYTAEDDGNSL